MELINRVKRERISILFFFFFSIMYYVLSFSGLYKYAVVILAAMCCFFIGRKRIQGSFFIILLPSMVYCVIGAVTGLFNHGLSMESIKMCAFLLIPPLAAISIISMLFGENVDKIVNAQFVAIMVVYLLLYAPEFSVENFMESQYAFIFGAYVIYYLQKKKKIYTLLALALTIMANKRIALFAMVVCIVYIIICELISKKIPRKYLLIISAVITIAVGYVWIWSVHSDTLEHLLSSFGIDEKGRIATWKIFSGDYSMSAGFLGHGMGWVRDLLSQWKIIGYDNLHNDLLMAYLELGFWGYGIFFLSNIAVIFVLCKKQLIRGKDATLYFALLIYTFINYFTDNILIYINYWFPLGILLLSLYKRGDKKDSNE